MTWGRGGGVITETERVSVHTDTPSVALLTIFFFIFNLNACNLYLSAGSEFVTMRAVAEVSETFK